MSATVSVTKDGFSVSGAERLNYNFVFVENVFDLQNEQLADLYRPWKRCLLVTDATVNGFYGRAAKEYFDAKGIALTIHVMPGGEMHKTMTTMLSLVDAFNTFGLIRKEPVLAMGGGLVTDVCGFACASYRRSTNFIRIPTTLIGLIDASVSIKVGVNHGKLKNRLGAYHSPIVTFLDFSMLSTLPLGQVRNGFAELIKISSVGDITIWKLLEKYGEELVHSRFGRAPGASAEVRKAADEICYRGIKVMLELESPNLHEIGLDRVIAFGHTWSPTLELTPAIPLRHGHAINVDMAFSTTLAWTRGYISEAGRDEILGLMRRVGLTLDHELFDEELLDKGTAAILQTRDGMQRFVVPRPIGATHFVNDASREELHSVLRVHKQLVKAKYGGGAGEEAYVDFGDLGTDPAHLLALGDSESKSAAAINGASAVPSSKLPRTVTNGYSHEILVA
ncbi:Dehydroquinate synthase-like protein [Exidia glandulosa HHB12029]|uniref:Dehydroquinate synthase-like protein n=1 Tax=Exidia glandulosa HHB12029 TaxID=1314781 RepID=A0A165J3Q4_EXIGL|nr:Dehydroquinate synthase-like protein [Exidia glandulosa HHB12029]